MAEAESPSEGVVRRFFEALNTGELDRIRPLVHPEATWTPMGKTIPGAGVHTGRKGIVDEFLGPIRGLFVDGDPKNEILTLFSKGEMVLAETHGTGLFRNGKTYDNRYCWVVEVRDGMILTIREYMDTAYILTVVD